jgi:O-glycosyl hydrolase
LTIGALAATAALKGPVADAFNTIKGFAETAALKVLYAKDAISGLGGVGGTAKAGLGGLTVASSAARGGWRSPA